MLNQTILTQREMTRPELREPGFDNLPEGLRFVPLDVPAARPAAAGRGSAVRQMTREQGRALETLAHAVEYLQDEASLAFARSGGRGVEGATLEAVDVLKASSRQLWGSLPVREPLWRRWMPRRPGEALPQGKAGGMVTFPLS